jgi:predicted alpha/beta superfamily hydrolase
MLKLINYLDKELMVITKGKSDKLILMIGENEAYKYLDDIDYNILIINNIDWDNELAPWDIKEGKMFTFNGGADLFLNKVEDILRYVINLLSEENIHISNVTICGYSLAGLFSTYAIFKSNSFDSLISVSSSFWYPKFIDFVKSHKISDKISKIYFSLGDLEGKTRTKFFKDIDLATEMVYNSIEKTISNKKFEYNHGNHFDMPDQRLAKGIRFILSK